jgi:phosphoribosyl 1,2-cyclic phosphodiesterase
MQLVSLGSGSKGNSTYIEIGGRHLLIDVGLSTKRINEELLIECGIDLDDIELIFITHEHSDHIQSLPMIYKKYPHIKIVATQDVFEGVLQRTKLYIDKERKVLVQDGNYLKGNSFDVKPLRINHDVPTYAFLFTEKSSGERLAFISDNGGIVKNNMIQILTGYDYYVLESNHDLTMQIFSERHEGLKRRVLNYYGHTHNAYAIEFIMRVMRNNTKAVLFNHLSEECNTEELCSSTHRELIKIWGRVTDFKNVLVKYARQNESVRLL